MPLYEYHCNNCGKNFEKIVRFSEATLAPICPVCQSQDTKKKISMAASFNASMGNNNLSSSGGSCGSRGGFS